MKTLLENIKLSEGYSSVSYKDTLGFDTIGYGTKLPLSGKEARMVVDDLKETYIDKKVIENALINILTTNKIRISKIVASDLLRNRVNITVDNLQLRLPFIKTLPKEIENVLYEMAYQMGVDGLLEFHNTINFLKDGKYAEASVEMLDSRWAEQTSNRAKKLSDVVLNFA